jgi:FdrA protein
MSEGGNKLLNGLLDAPPAVVNVGLEGFARDLEAVGVQVVQVDWSPPAGGDPKMAALLAKLGV